MFQLSTALSFALLAIANAMPPGGNYNIVNRVMSSTGQQLALTYGGANSPITVEPYTSSKNISQIFKLTRYDAITMSVTPQANGAQQLVPSDDKNGTYIYSGPYQTAVYNINNNSSGFFIGGGSVIPDSLWHPETAEAGGKIVFKRGQPGTGDFRAFWVLISA